MRIQAQSKVFIVGPEDKILLIKRSGGLYHRPRDWEIPGSHVEGGEYMAEAAALRTFEQTGITIDPQEIELVYTFTERPADDLNAIWLFYRAKTVRAEVSISNEHDEYRWMAPDEALNILTFEREHRALRYLVDNGLIKVKQKA